MKKILAIVVAVVFCSTAAFAQQKGDQYFGGSAGVIVQSVGVDGISDSAAGFSIKPEYGYFVADRLKVGASLGYAIESSVHTFLLMPNISYYARLCDGLYYTPGLELGLVVGSMEGITLPGFGLSAHLFTLEFRPTEHFGFSANLLSLNFVTLSKEGLTANMVDFNLGVNPTVGFKYYF